MAGELVSMSAKELDRLEVVRRVVDGPLSQVKAAGLLGLTSQSRAWPPLAGASAHGRDARRGRPCGSRPEQRDNGEQG